MYPNPLPSQVDPYVPVTPVGKSVQSPMVTVSAKRTKPVDPDQPGIDFLAEAHDRFRKCTQAEKDWRKNATEEFDFVDGLRHWTQDQRDERKGRPCLVFDRIGPSCDQVVNNMRQSPPEARVSPVGDGTDKEEAVAIEGLLRNIDQDSSAEIAYMTAYEHAVKIGRGAWRITYDWETDDWERPEAGPELLYQKLVVKRISNPFSVYPDPSADEFDYSDMRFCFVTEDLDKGEFIDKYPDANVTAGMSTAEFSGEGDRTRALDWFPNGGVRVAEYWWIDTEKADVVVTMDGRVVKPADAPRDADGEMDESQIRGRRTVYRRKVHGAKLTGAEVLELWDWNGKWIPIIFCIGREVIDEGKRKLRGMIRPAMDANLAYDYMASKEAEAIGLAPISQWLVAAGSIEGHEYKWADANRKSLAYLEWKHWDPENPEAPPIPAPIRVNSEPAVQAISLALSHRDEDVKTSLSTWGPNLGGPQEGELSGKAIGLRQRQSDNAHFNYADNLARSMKHSARVELDLIPYVYSEPRVLTIIDPDQTIRKVAINQVAMMKGVQRILKIGIDYSPARCDITIGTGPSYASRRLQQTDVVMQMMQTMPGPMSRVLDLVTGLIDLPKEFQDRLRPPDVQQTQDAEDGSQAPPIPPQAQQALQQMQQMVQAQSQAIHKLSDIIEQDVLKYQSAERIATQGNITKVLVAEAASKSEEAQQSFQLEHKEVEQAMEHRLDLLHTAISVEQDAAELAAQTEPQPPAANPGQPLAPGAAPAAPPIAPPPATPIQPAP